MGAATAGSAFSRRTLLWVACSRPRRCCISLAHACPGGPANQVARHRCQPPRSRPRASDWVAGLLHGAWRATDYNNALKLGYDPAAEAYPEWLTEQVRGWGTRWRVGRM